MWRCGTRPGKACAACDRSLGAGEVYYRFAVALEGELDALGAVGGSTREELAATITALEQGPEDPSRYEDEVHWERAGVLCASCRAALMTMLGGAKPAAH